MNRSMMKSKVHRATITGANLEYVGSITLDRALMELADIREFEQVAVLDIDNGARFETYAMEGGPGDVIINGAAARLVQPGDRVIVITYGSYDEVELAVVRAADRARRRGEPADRRGRSGAARRIEPRLDARPSHPAPRLTPHVRRPRVGERRRGADDCAPRGAPGPFRARVDQG